MKYRNIFRQIGREHQILVYYYQSNISKIVSLWDKAKGGEDVAANITLFFDELLSMIDSQVQTFMVLWNIIYFIIYCFS